MNRNQPTQHEHHHHHHLVLDRRRYKTEKRRRNEFNTVRGGQSCVISNRFVTTINKPPRKIKRDWRESILCRVLCVWMKEFLSQLPNKPKKKQRCHKYVVSISICPQPRLTSLDKIPATMANSIPPLMCNTPPPMDGACFEDDDDDDNSHNNNNDHSSNDDDQDDIRMVVESIADDGKKPYLANFAWGSIY